MPKGLSDKDRRRLRDKLVAVVDASEVKLDQALTDDTSLIRSGAIDSLALFNIAVFVDKEVPHHVDITAYDLAKEWDSINDILNFIGRLRNSG